LGTREVDFGSPPQRDTGDRAGWMRAPAAIRPSPAGR